MSFRTWLRRDRLLPRLALALRRLQRSRSLAAWRGWPYVVAGASLVPYLAVWYDPTLFQRAVVGFGGLVAAAAALMWLGAPRVGSWLAGVTTLAALWASQTFIWLFLESTGYRLVCLALVAATTFVLLAEWQRRQRALAAGSDLTNSTPVLAAGFLAAFGFGVGAESLLVFLETPLWQLALATYLPTVLCFVALAAVSGWSLARYWRHLTAAAVILGETFILVTWWPSSAYVAGFTMATAYLALTLVLRQEVQGFFSRRSFSRELAALAGLLVLVLVTARWF